MFRCGLSKLAEELRVVRIGMQHQAGSDSYVTCKVFYNLSFDYLTEEEIEASRGILFGIGKGVEDYSSYFNNSYTNKTNNNPKVNYSYDNSSQQIYSMNQLNLQYFNNNGRNNNINNFIGFNNYNMPLHNINNLNYQSQQDFILMQNSFDNINSYQQNINTTNSKKSTPIKNGVVKT